MFNDDEFGGNPPFMPHNTSFGGPFRSLNRQFEDMYRCYPIAMMDRPERDNVNYGGKIILPQSALERLCKWRRAGNEIHHAKHNRHSHAGVLEFTAEEGRAYLPQWMMETLSLEPDSLLDVKNVTLPLGSFVKIQPQSPDFLDISDPKAVLENALRNFSTLTTDDVIQISYNDKVYGIKVLEVKPNFEEHSGISIVETDLEVDFAPPVGYVEPTRSTPASSIKSQMIIDNPPQKTKKSGLSVFDGPGQSLRGKSKAGATAHEDDMMDTSDSQMDPNDERHLNLSFGQLYFGFPIVAPKSQAEKDAKPSTFSGEGHQLRDRKKPAKP